MQPKSSSAQTPWPCSISTLFLSISLLFVASFVIFISSYSNHFHPPQISLSIPQIPQDSISVYIAELPRTLNYGLLDQYWSLPHDSRVSYDPDHGPDSAHPTPTRVPGFPPYAENPLIKQYSAEYWILGDLMTPENLRTASFAKRVLDSSHADVVFVPFFATLSAEMQLSVDRGSFRKQVSENQDYRRQKEMIDLVKSSDAWIRSGGRDHVFVLTDPVALWHVKEEISPSILLVVDFGGWFRADAKSSVNGSSSERIGHTQVSLIKDVIVPYTHLLPRLLLSEDRPRHTLLYFKGAKHRQRGGIVREKLWDLLVNERGVVMEEGFPNATGKEQSIKGMRSSEFCLHPAGDTPTSCRIFDAIQSLCIPVIVSDQIELPFEGMIDYSDFSIFVSTSKALQPNWLVQHLRSFTEDQKEEYRRNMGRVQPLFEYDSGNRGGIGPIPIDGAVNSIWRKVHQKLPLIKEAIVRERRKPHGSSIPLRCHCS
ncbi:hypothetical protein V2J09_008536 [Rumex salicifolius]